MNNELSKRQRVLFLIAVMLSNIAVMGDNVIYTISNNIYNAFPDASGAVNYILSGPPLLLVIASLAAPFILKKVSKRSLLITGAALFTVGSVLGVVILNPAWMIATRSIVGIGQGFINVCAISLVSDVYYEENLRSRFVGYFNASMNIIGMLLSYFAGVIAQRSDWTNTFKLYWSAIPMLIMVILFVPKIKPAEELTESSEETSETSAKKTGKHGFSFGFWKMIILFFVGATLCMCVAYYMSVYVSENSLGGESLTGTAITVGQIVSFFGAMIYGALYSKLKHRTSLIGYICILLAMLLWWLIPSKATVFVVYSLESLGYLILLTYAYASGPMMVSASRADLAISIATAAYGIASFISTYFVSLLMKIMNTSLVSDLIPVLAAISVVILVLDLVLGFKKKEAKENA